MKLLKICLSVLFALAVVQSCKKPNEYPDEPVIEFKSIDVLQDSNGYDVTSHLVISFTDGDGDIGYLSTGNGSPFDDTSSVYYHNFIVRMDTLHNGVWGTVVDDDTLFSGRIPYLTPDGNIKALKGDIATDIFLLYGYP